MKNDWVMFFGALSLVAMCMVTTNDASASWLVKDTFNGMTVEQTFPDKKVSALVDAVSHGHFKEADKQLASGADVNAVGQDGLSPLIWVIHATEYDLEKMEYLLKAGANPNYINNNPESAGKGDSAMSWAVEQNLAKPLLLLLQYRGNPNLFDSDNNPFLYAAALSARKDIMAILLDHGADINIHNQRGGTAGDAAAAVGHFDLVAYLLEHGLSYNLQGLAKSVDGRIEAIGDEAIKIRVIEMLKARGAKFPAFNPRNPRDPEPWNCERTQNRNVRCEKYKKG